MLNWIKNTYRKVIGKPTLEQEQSFRNWSGYEGKIKKASVNQNIAVNAELQARIYEAEGKGIKAREIRKEKQDYIQAYQIPKSTYQEKKIEFYSDEKCLSLLERRFKLSLANYVKAYYWDIPAEKQKAIYLSLYESYREIYGTQKSGKIVELSDQLNLQASQKKREIVRKNALERLAA
ncbi:MAG: hypothetical protein WC584_03720 [Candidatus Pacearchaeota archaeon]